VCCRLPVNISVLFINMKRNFQQQHFYGIASTLLMLICVELQRIYLHRFCTFHFFGWVDKKMLVGGQSRHWLNNGQKISILFSNIKLLPISCSVTKEHKFNCYAGHHKNLPTVFRGKLFYTIEFQCLLWWYIFSGCATDIALFCWYAVPLTSSVRVITSTLQHLLISIGSHIMRLLTIHWLLYNSSV